MEKSFVGAVDQGTTSTRFILFNQDGTMAGSAQLEHEQIYPAPGYVEHDPMEIWENTCKVIQMTLKETKIHPNEIAAVGITNQRETTVVWNKRTGKPYTNAIVWQDTRTDDFIEELARDGGLDRFRKKTGLPLATYFSGPKIRWILDNVPGVREDAEKGEAVFGTVDSWLIYNLTGGANGGEHITDVTNASRTLLFNLESLSWDSELINALGIPAKMLPEIRPSIPIERPYGMTRKDGPFGAEIPVAGALGDQQAALFGQACYRTGELKNTYGTGCFMLLNTGPEIVHSKSGLITTVGYQIGKQTPVYALEGSIAIAGALIQWIRDNLGMIADAPEIDVLAQSVPDSGGVYIVPAFSGLYAPYWRMDARGVICGLTRYVRKEHLARAVLEATAFQTREIFDAMEKDSGIKIFSLKVDGGMVKSEPLMQFQADMLGVPVIRPSVTETTALGAAYAAGLFTGFWRDQIVLASQWSEDKRFMPEMDEEDRKTKYHFWKKAVTRSFDWME